jgi:hypothetical protein
MEKIHKKIHITCQEQKNRKDSIPVPEGAQDQSYSHDNGKPAGKYDEIVGKAHRVLSIHGLVLKKYSRFNKVKRILSGTDFSMILS